MCRSKSHGGRRCAGANQRHSEARRAQRPEQQDAIATPTLSEDWKERRDLAQADDTAPEVLALLAADEVPLVRKWASRAPGLPLNNLLGLAQDDDESVRRVAREQAPYQQWAEQRNREALGDLHLPAVELGYEGSKVLVSAPFSESWNRQAKQLDGWWDPGKKVWMVEGEPEAIRTAIEKVYNPGGLKDQQAAKQQAAVDAERAEQRRKREAERETERQRRWDAGARKAQEGVPNRYAGQCTACGGSVAPGSGIARKEGSSWVVAHISCPAEMVARRAERDAATLVQQGSGNGGVARRPGEVFWHDGGPVTVVDAEDEYIRDEGLSFGAGEDRGYIHRAWVRPATPEEATPLLAERAEQQRRADARDLVQRALKTSGERPSKITIDEKSAEVVELSDQRGRIYGTRVYAMIEPEGTPGRRIVIGDYRGGDGDTWGEFNLGHNTRGVVLHYSDEVAAALRLLGR